MRERVEHAVAVEVDDRMVLRDDARPADRRVTSIGLERQRLILDDRDRGERAVALVLVDEPRVEALAAHVGRPANGGARVAAAARRGDDVEAARGLLVLQALVHVGPVRDTQATRAGAGAVHASAELLAALARRTRGPGGPADAGDARDAGLEAIALRVQVAALDVVGVDVAVHRRDQVDQPVRVHVEPSVGQVRPVVGARGTTGAVRTLGAPRRAVGVAVQRVGARLARRVGLVVALQQRLGRVLVRGDLAVERAPLEARRRAERRRASAGVLTRGRVGASPLQPG